MVVPTRGHNIKIKSFTFCQHSVPVNIVVFLGNPPSFIIRSFFQAARYRMAMEEKGTPFAEEIDIDEDQDVEVFRVPAHNDVDGADFYQDFKMVSLFWIYDTTSWKSREKSSQQGTFLFCICEMLSSSPPLSPSSYVSPLLSLVINSTGWAEFIVLASGVIYRIFVTSSSLVWCSTKFYHCFASTWHNSSFFHSVLLLRGFHLERSATFPKWIRLCHLLRN